ncbi:uncharacterized protein LOC127761482 [Oryza glaberrima]|uniref:uncharacterized protein LOC127761482 n=1 Tax=Oryza glaberrima TaxID=4538 RepID=UPI00224C44FB|nr:uncharacterized protein LOC127761482 [Oryza glaberrima]
MRRAEGFGLLGTSDCEEDGGSAAASSPPRHRRSVTSSAPPPPLRLENFVRLFDLLIPNIAAPPRSTYYGVSDQDLVHCVGDLSRGGARAPFRVHEQEESAGDPGLRYLLNDRSSNSSNADLEAEREAALVRQAHLYERVRTSTPYHTGSANGVLKISGARGLRTATNAWNMRACRPFSTAPPPPPEPVPPVPKPPLPPSTHALQHISDDEDRCRYRDSNSLHSCYNPLDFVKKYPVVQFVQLKCATTAKFDRYVLKGWFQYAARDLLKSIGEHHLADLELNAITLDTLVVSCNMNAAEFLPKFKVRCETQKATDEGKMKNYQQAADVFKKLIDASVDDPDLWALLSEDAKHWLQNLDNPNLSEVYLLVNHTCFLPVQLYSHFYLACYDQLMRVPRHYAQAIFSQLPYRIGDPKGDWKTRAMQHPLLREHLLIQGANYGNEDSEQGRYRRNVPSHKTKLLGPYSPEEVDRILHLHFEKTNVDLMRTMWRRGLTYGLGLEKFFK